MLKDLASRVVNSSSTEVPIHYEKFVTSTSFRRHANDRVQRETVKCAACNKVANLVVFAGLDLWMHAHLLQAVTVHRGCCCCCDILRFTIG